MSPDARLSSAWTGRPVPIDPSPSPGPASGRSSIAGVGGAIGSSIAAPVLVYLAYLAGSISPASGVYGPVPFLIAAMGANVLLGSARRWVESALAGPSPAPEAERWRGSRAGWERTVWNRRPFPGFDKIAIGLALIAWQMGSVLPRTAAIPAATVLLLLLSVAVLLPFVVHWRSGGLRVVWSEFPIRTGGTAVFCILRTGGSDGLSRVRVRLRCVTQRSRWFRTPHRTEIAAFEWDSELPVPVTGDEPVVVGFEIPAELPGTDVTGKSRVVWELLVAIRTGTVTVREALEVPIYAVAAATTPPPAQLA